MQFTVDKSRDILPQKIRELLKKKGATQQDLADYLGITRQAVNNYCVGKTYPIGDLILKIADFFNVPAEYIISGYQPEQKAIRDELKLSAAALEMLKSVSSGELHDIFFFVDKLLSDKGFYLAMISAITTIETTQTVAINLSREGKTEIEKIILREFLDFGKDKATKKLADYFMSFADKLYPYKIDE